MSKWITAAAAAMLSLAFHAHASDVPCAVVTKAGKGAQIIPEKGHVESRVRVDQGIACGSMMITHAEPVWIRLSNMTVVKLGPETFVEIADPELKRLRLYRGSALLTAPASLAAQVWTTPNAELEFHGGVSVLQYTPADRVSIAGCFNRKVSFRNKFNEAAAIELSAGEMSHLAITEGRVKPSRAGVMHHSAVAEVLAQFGLENAEREQFVAVVKQVYEDRAKSLVSGIESFGEGSDGPGRTIASVPQGSKHVIDPKEAAFTLKLLKERIYGSEDEQNRFAPPPIRVKRAPASVNTALGDDVKVNQEKKFKQESKRIGKEIERLDLETDD
ncbi:MAG: hypothetical protein EBX52_09380 [Proteobacteria bacterium]|nr:hypothetical protein [Pseudomonadota bacterium]